MLYVIIKMINLSYFFIIFNDFLNRVRVKEEIIKEVKNKMGKEVYNIMFRNCESFVNMCRYGNFIFFQVSININYYFFNIFVFLEVFNDENILIYNINIFKIDSFCGENIFGFDDWIYCLKIYD